MCKSTELEGSEVAVHRYFRPFNFLQPCLGQWLADSDGAHPHVNQVLVVSGVP